MAGIESLLHGRVLGGRYRIEEVIGRGGMGAVYRAVDERLGRSVAVKVITIAGSDAEARERLRARFHREARAAAALPHHPNVVPVYDYGTDEALSLDFIVMELLRGYDLATRLTRGEALPLADALRILHEAARGVAVGHRAGLIHRDVKPGNIFLTQDAQGEVQVRVVDFGIAKLADDEDTFSQLTMEGKAPHSPAYASPEQLRGLGNLTPSSDVFSLGAVGFQLLTGERPFSEADRNKMSLGMPVHSPSVRERNPSTPAAIDAIVGRALAFEPQARFPDAGAMAHALEQALRAMPDAALDPYQASPAMPIPRLPYEPQEEEDDRTQLVGTVGEDDRTLLDPGAGMAAPMPPRPRPAPARADARPLPPRRQEPERRGVGGIVVWTLVLLLLAGAGFWAWSEISRPAGDDRLAEGEIPDAPADLPLLVPDEPIQEPPGTQPELDALVHNQEGNRLFQQGDFRAALEQFRFARDLAPENSLYRYNYATVLRQLGNHDAAVQEFRQVVRLQPSHAGAHYNLGLAQLEMGDTAAGWVSLQSALEHSTDPRERAAVTRRLQAIEFAQRGPAIPAPDTQAVPRDTIRFPVPRDTIRDDSSPIS